MRALRSRSSRYPQPRHAILHQREAARTYDSSDRLGQIRVPTLILHGKKDSAAPYGLAEVMRVKIAGSELRTFAGGHHFLFFQSDEFFGAVEEFLARESPRPGET